MGATSILQRGNVSARSVRKRRTHAADAVGEFRELARGEDVRFQEVENERVHVGAHQLYCIERKRVNRSKA